MMKYIDLTHFNLDGWMEYLCFKERAIQSQMIFASVLCACECYFLEDVEFVLIINNFVFI